MSTLMSPKAVSGEFEFYSRSILVTVALRRKECESGWEKRAFYTPTKTELAIREAETDVRVYDS